MTRTRFAYAAARRVSFQPLVEELERREVPSTSTWDGGGFDNNWMTAANWVGDVAPVAGNDLVFRAGAAQTNNNNNFAAGTAFKSITLSADFYQLSGNGITLNSGITATSGYNHLFVPITLAAGPAYDGGDFVTTGTGVLYFYNPVNNNGHLLRTDVSAAGRIDCHGMTGSGGL